MNKIADSRKKILIIDDCQDDRNDIEAFLSNSYNCMQAADSYEAFILLEAGDYHLILLDIEFEGEDKGFLILSKIIEKYPDIPVVMVTKYADVEKIVRAVQLGAVHYVHKREMANTLHIAIEKAFKEAAIIRAAMFSMLSDRTLENSFIGKSEKIVRIKEHVEKIADGDLPVLLTGETGTGKDIVAKMIHHLSSRSNYPFMPVICTEFAPELVSDELFGHERGSFSNAIRKRIGRIETADRGTIFLNEIADVDSGNQQRLRRVIETGEFERIGSSDTINVDVRFIAATNRNIEELVDKGDFQKDLYYRLKGHVIHIPALRERREDIPLLVTHFLKVASYKSGSDVPALKPGVMDYLKNRDWPGNVRELETCINRAVIISDDETISIKDLFDPVQKKKPIPEYRQAIEEFKKKYLADLLDHYEGKVELAARHAGVAREYYYSLMKKHNIRKNRE